MIKINLANKKRAVATTGAKTQRFSGPSLNLKIDLSQFKDPALRSFFIAIGVMLGTYFIPDLYKQEELQKLDTQIARVEAQIKSLQGELAKLAEFQKLKQTLDSDEATIKTKIEVVRNLTRERDWQFHFLRMLSKGIPAEAWLTNVAMSGAEVKVQGESQDFAYVSSFLKSVNESALVSGSVLDSTELIRNSQGLEIARFGVTVKRK